ncbi:hypothetical protein ABIA30_005190 [Mycobacterium sp. MAA66]|uniref:DUF4865 family protein n=1 Tax=Mycobacterium sp. MAA66 TaxID=3156297 RepID=UPI003519BC6D
MIVAHYEHRFPEWHGVSRERELTQEDSARWDSVPGMYFKAFLIREKGRYGAAWNGFSSLYLWDNEDWFGNFLVPDPAVFAHNWFGINNVVKRFGRPQIATSTVLDARKGPGENARFAYIEHRDIHPDADIAATSRDEIANNQAAAAAPGTVATVAAINPNTWRFTRILLSENAPTGAGAAAIYQIEHLAQPLLHTLPDSEKTIR